jgi:hypothetical protein
LSKKRNVFFALSLLHLLSLRVPAGAETIHIPVSCEIAGKVDAGLERQVCNEMVSVLELNYPGFSFEPGSALAAPSLTILLLNATPSGLGLQLRWRNLSGDETTGEPMSTIIMDRKLGLTHRQSLYRRVVASTPMPQ